MTETEQVFFNAPLLILEDSKHNKQEPRFHVLGKSDENRQLHITFTPVKWAGNKQESVTKMNNSRLSSTFYFISLTTEHSLQ